MNLTPNRKWPLIFATALIGGLLISAGVFSANRQQQPKKKEWPKEPPVTSMPPVYSKVNKLEVVRAWIVRENTPSPAASVEIRNNSKKDVVAVDLVCGNGAVTRNGLYDEEHPVVVVKAGETLIMEMNFSEMTFGAPLVVSAVTYSDGTEEGDEKSLSAMRLARAHDRARLKARKEQEREKGVTRP